MTTTITTSQTTLTEPSILTANTYFWTAACNASSRRRNEERKQTEVANYLSALGFSVVRSGDNVTGTLLTAKGEVRVVFHYSESCKNVYKSLSVTRGGKNSNITTIRKIANQ